MGGFFFSRTVAHAHSQPFGLATADRRWRSSIPQVAEVWRLGEDLPREAVPRKFSEAEATVQPGPPPRRIPGHSPFTLAGSASTRPGAARGPGSRLSSRSSTVGETLSSRGPKSGGGDAGGPLGGEERRPPGVVARRRHLLHRGWHHLPAGARGCAGAFLGGGHSRESLGFVWGADPKPLSLPGRAAEFSSKENLGLPFPGVRELCGPSRPCRWLQSRLVKFAPQPAATARPGRAKGSQGHPG